MCFLNKTMVERTCVAVVLVAQLCIIGHLLQSRNLPSSCELNEVHEKDDYKVERVEEEEIQFCSNSDCDEIKLNDIPKMYRSLFISEKEHEKRMDVQREDRRREMEKEGANEESNIFGDGDSCCATKVEFTKPETMEDVRGVSRRLVHFKQAVPPRYQMVPTVSCLNMGGCTGQCRMEPSYTTYLVFGEYGASVQIEWFKLPGYCSCKNIRHSAEEN